ncbi:carbohydrate kinase family protein [Caproiciproducens sp. LBM24188]
MFDVVALGESLIDFTPCGKNDMGMQLFACNPGGAPANVLAMVSKLGGKTAFIGKVGKDDFGVFLKNTMENTGIDVSGLAMTEDVHTTLAFVQLNEHGERSFSFYRKPGADITLTVEEVDESLLRNCKIFHFGSVSLTDEPCRSATLQAVEKAKSAGAIISYDPNYRPLLWDSPEHAKSEIRSALSEADLVKVSEEEMTLITGETDYLAGAKKLAQYGATLIMITLGPKGAFYFTHRANGKLPTYPVKTVDTTGAGDTFWGALLHCVCKKSLEELRLLSDREWQHITAFGNAAGSLTTTRKGAIPAMPSLEQIQDCMAKSKLLERP